MRPMSTIEMEGFRELLEEMVPNYIILSRYIIRNEIIESYEKTSHRLKEILSKIKYFSLTTDGWSAITAKSYITYTIHFIDDDWELNNYTLQTQCMEVCIILI